jgi:DnaJ-class molecular chaperone
MSGTRKELCPKCKGFPLSGPDDKLKVCTGCNGQGVIIVADGAKHGKDDEGKAT